MKKSTLAVAVLCGALALVASDSLFAQTFFGGRVVRRIFRRPACPVVCEPCQNGSSDGVLNDESNAPKQGTSEAPVVEEKGVELTAPEAPVVEEKGVELTAPEAPVVEEEGVELTAPEAPVAEEKGVEQAAPEKIASEKTVEGEQQVSATFEVSEFGQTKEGETVRMFTLTNANGLTAKILDFGGVLYEMNVPDAQGNFANISCNYPTVPEYQDVRPFFGSLIGRYGNRIALGKFTLDGVEYTLPINNDPNALHGGLKGFDQKIWAAEPAADENGASLKLSYTAKDGEEGYPGNLSVVVVYTLSNDNKLTIDYTATTDKATPVNLTNHTFWNLGGATSGSIRDTFLRLGASYYLPTNDSLIPTGEIASVEGTPLDFRAGKAIGQEIDAVAEPQFNGGYDHCFVLDQANPGELTFCALAVDPATGRTMTIETTEPAVQFYSGNFLDGSTSVGDYKYEKHSAFCLETQHYPDSPNQPAFPTTILNPGETYRHTTVHTFGVAE